MSLFHRFVELSYKAANVDEPWLYEEEPHSDRRKEILRKYPQIKKLMGHDPWMVVFVTIEIIIQLFMCYIIQDANWPTLLISAYVIGGTINHSLGSAIHEIGHNLAFGHKYPLWNRALGFWTNLPMGIPISVTYKRYHSDHHRYLGHDEKDVDVPTVFESWLFRHPLLKIIWLILHPVIHGIRPYVKSPKPPNWLEITNLICQFSFNFFILYVFGYKALAYLIIGTLMALGCHPLAGHFISEHYLFNKGQATHSYYGPLNFILYNVGYHNEHHDFPYIPWRKLPEVRKIAPEYYDNIPCHTSWFKVIWDFIWDENMGPHAHGLGFLPADHPVYDPVRHNWEKNSTDLNSNGYNNLPKKIE
ncbi:DgyrCDS2754 [Dimorphilus gyrociliatus]|uniref:sphingolipid 4-desaturase n=1 Tax=Dimorphilus gyrociliatus TaxID=2664684 RepID=A0A7I8VD01_9ANNE|nr:DgyrCDS2754 [Dimorphilus gyrociliatus]